MTSPIVVRYDGLGRGIEQAGSAIAGALQQRAERERYKRGGTILQELINETKDMSPQNMQALVNKAIEKDVPLDLINTTYKMYEPYIKYQAQAQAAEQYLNGDNLPSQDNSVLRGALMEQQGIPPFLSQAQRQQQGLDSSPITIVKEAKAKPISISTPEDLDKLSNRDLLKLSQSPFEHHVISAKFALDQRKMAAKNIAADRAYHAKKLESTEKKVEGLRESLPKKEFALQLAKDAIASGEIGVFSLNNLAQRLGLPELRTAKGLQLITSSKEQFLSNMSRVSAKGQNQFFEQRLLDMLPKIGQSKEANDTVQTIMEGELEMDKEYLKTYSQLEQEDIEKYGYPKSSLPNRVQKIVDAKYQEIFSKTGYKLREIYEREKGYEELRKISMKPVPKGTYLTPEMAQIIAKNYNGNIKKATENAIKLGYKLPSQEEITLWR